MQKVNYYFFRLMVFLFSLMPFFLLYFLADVLAFTFYKILKYRKKVVFENLNRCFPEKSKKEIENIAKQFYRNLADITLEAIKGFSISKKTALKRYQFLNFDILNQDINKGKNCILAAGHYGNWEWSALAGKLQFEHEVVAFYKPLKNPIIDNYIRKKRSQFGVWLKSIKGTNQTFEEFEKKKSIYLFGSDQNPSNTKEAIWVNFFNEETACLHGMEKYAKKYDLAVYYGNIQRIKRGYYQVEISKITSEANENPHGKITSDFMNLLEQTIQQKPQDWLWSHKRWKHKRHS